MAVKTADRMKIHRVRAECPDRGLRGVTARIERKPDRKPVAQYPPPAEERLRTEAGRRRQLR